MIDTIKKEINHLRSEKKASTYKSFFKNRDLFIFLGVSTPLLKKLVKNFVDLPFEQIKKLLHSSIFDERMFAVLLLVQKYAKGFDQERIIQFYLEERAYLTNWALVDASAPYLLGKHLLHQDKKILYTLASSPILWDRRIAIVSTWWFIRNKAFDDSLLLSEKLLQDKEDLIHKAVGWMLRELGKKEALLLESFLEKHACFMPRTMLRYAIERLSPKQRAYYLEKKKIYSKS